MHIALISYEFPPSVAVGGIGTYAWQASRMLGSDGHVVSVFAAGHADAPEHPHPGVAVHRVAAADRRSFAHALVPALAAAHARSPFDLIEAPEIGAEGAPAFQAAPSAARVVKLHTPSFLVQRLGFEPPGIAARLRFFAGALRRGRLRLLRQPHYLRDLDPEYHGALLADEIAAPSRAIAQILQREWSLDPERIDVCPLPFAPPQALLDLPLPRQVKTIGFLGRLEPRKGVLELVRSIPGILQKAPSLQFRFIGPSWPYRNSDVRAWIECRFPALRSYLHFSGAVAPDQLPTELAACDVLALPSRWENFPFACWEALASGRVVIGSSAGGMAEVIEHGVSGLLVPPFAPEAITSAVLDLAAATGKITALGAAGRRRVTTLLAPARILPLHMASYERALQRAGQRRDREGVAR